MKNKLEITPSEYSDQSLEELRDWITRRLLEGKTTYRLELDPMYTDGQYDGMSSITLIS